MVVPLGFGVGDLLAVSRLIYKIGLELKKNPDSGPDYQHLLGELESLDRALKQLQCIRPAHHKLRRLEGIRALASTCQRPLEEFLAKIEKFEEHLGPWGAKCNRLSGFGRRLQWSTKYKEDVKELRAKLAPNIATITILLMTQTLETLSKAESDRLEIARELKCKLSSQETCLVDLKRTALNIATTQARLEAGQTGLAAKAAGQDQELCSLHSKADELLKNDNTHKLHLHDQDNILGDIRKNAITINAYTRETHTVVSAMHQGVAGTQATAGSILSVALEIMSAVTAGISKMQEITELIAQMIRLTARFTIEMREIMGRLLQVFWDIQIQLARLERFIPRQIDLPVVRFRDAFNETRFLPYDLSRQWQTFQGLVAVVFMNRQGLHRVNMGQYFVTNARLGRRLNPAFWSNAIEPGDELSMTMVLNDVEAQDGFCPFKSCGASTKHVEMRRGGKFCPTCFRFAVLSQRKPVTPPVKRLKHRGRESRDTPPAPDSDVDSSDFSGDGDAIKLEEAPMHAPQVESSAEDIELYYSIQVVQALSSYPLVLKLNGDLDAMAERWSVEEFEARRRLVQFTRRQNGSTIHADFKSIAPEDRPPNSITISCIWWEEKKECFVTSPDTIFLLESLVAVRFTVEEKNLIRRNLEGFRPLTVFKSKAESEDFFKTIMGFPDPKPRNIKKDVKVFPWKILAHALKKMIIRWGIRTSAQIEISGRNFS